MHVTWFVICSLATASASLACCDGLFKLASGRHQALRQHCFAVPHVQQSFNWCAFGTLVYLTDWVIYLHDSVDYSPNIWADWLPGLVQPHSS